MNAVGERPGGLRLEHVRASPVERIAGPAAVNQRLGPAFHEMLGMPHARTERDMSGQEWPASGQE